MVSVMLTALQNLSTEPVLAVAVANQFFVAHSLTRCFGFWRDLLVCFGGGVWFFVGFSSFL